MGGFRFVDGYRDFAGEKIVHEASLQKAEFL
jgi:hypothetical protein